MIVERRRSAVVRGAFLNRVGIMMLMVLMMTGAMRMLLFV